MKSHKIAIVTWIYFKNFGTFLQAYALQRVIRELGYDCRVIDDADFYTGNFYFRCKRFIKNILYRKLKSNRSYRKFKKKNINVFSNCRNIDYLNKHFDTFIAGSDQIWSPLLPKIRPYYYLDFTTQTKKRIAYAPSMVYNAVNDNYKTLVFPLMQRFNNLSLREQPAATYLSEQLNRKVSAVLDPTLLLDADKWSSITTPVKEKDFILCYFLTPHKPFVKFVTEYAKSVGKKLLVFDKSTFEILPSEYDFGDKLLKAGPVEFISYVKAADFIFTDSFHGTIFSIIFHKNFLTFQRFSNDSPQNQNGRLLNLFDILQISGRFININHLSQGLSLMDTLPPLDYEKIYTLLNQERNKSISYLKESLSSV